VNVIGAGLPRTGTLSLKLALDLLGLGPTYHTSDLLADPDRAALWAEALEGRRRWAKIFDGYHSAVGPPVSGFWEQLIGAYPNARVLLSVRDPESWGRAIGETAWGAREPLARLVEGMERHNEAVRRGVPRGRLLVWSAGEGWEPLCEFLGFPVPSVPFPHVGAGAELLNRVVASSLEALVEWPALRELPRAAGS
jgi:Sulfotransferase domain